MSILRCWQLDTNTPVGFGISTSNVIELELTSFRPGQLVRASEMMDLTLMLMSELVDSACIKAGLAILKNATVATVIIATVVRILVFALIIK